MRIVILSTFLLFVAACGTLTLPQLPFDWRDVVARLKGDLTMHQVYVGDPVYIRIFKEENILELWMQAKDTHRYTLVKTYPICNWSGGLGPKLREGDRQAPEGFYETNAQNLNPQSRYHVAFNIQFPNAYDRTHGRTGTFLMVHGDCVSDGCYAMTNEKMEEIYTLVERAIDAGQENVPVHIFPFRMTGGRLLQEVQSPWFNFWRNLKQGHDYFEQNGVPPKWVVENKRYEFY